MPGINRRGVAALVSGALTAAAAAALAYPPARRQALRLTQGALDALALRMDNELTRNLVLLTTEGRRTALPRTVILVSVDVGGQRYLLPWSRRAGWLANVRTHPEVVVDDRIKVRRATAVIVEDAAAERVRRRFLDRHVPGPLRAALGSGPLAKGLPAVRLDPR